MLPAIMAQKHSTSSSTLSVSLLVAIATSSVGCGNGLNVQLVDGAHARPSNVAMFFTVDDAEGEPVGGLAAESFVIYEDDQRVSPSESQQTIINQEVAAEHFTLLLVDMSGSVTESDWVPAITAAATEFTAAVEAQQQALHAVGQAQPQLRVVRPGVGIDFGDSLASPVVGEIARTGALLGPDLAGIHPHGKEVEILPPVVRVTSEIVEAVGVEAQAEFLPGLPQGAGHRRLAGIDEALGEIPVFIARGMPHQQLGPLIDDQQAAGQLRRVHGRKPAPRDGYLSAMYRYRCRAPARPVAGGTPRA